MDRRQIERVIRYEPLPSQRRFHESASRFKGFSGPIGSGKSQALCHEAIKMAYCNAGRMGLIGAPTFPMLRDATQATLFEILERNRLPYEMNKAENVLTLGDARSKIVFRAVDDFERLRGTNLAWFGIDELTYCPEEAWLRLEGRLRDPRASRLGGFAVWTPKGFDWVYRKFMVERGEGYEAIVAEPFENRHLLEKVPDFYDRLRQSYDERFYEQEVMGRYVNLSGGLVFSAFQREVHVAPVQVNPALPLFWALDFNVDPMSSVIAQMDGETVRVVDEIVLRRATTQEACREFTKRYPAHGAGVVVYGDASGHHMQTTGDSDYAVMRQYFAQTGGMSVLFRTPHSNPSVRARVMLTNSKLRNARGDAQMVVDPRCRELIKDFEQVSYKAESTEVDKDRDRQRTHLSDALGYLIWQECRPGPPPGERQERFILH